MNDISPLIPAVIIFVVGVNLIESLIKKFIGREKSENNQKLNNVSANEVNNKEKENNFNGNWSLNNDSDQGVGVEKKSVENIQDDASMKEKDNIDKSYFRNKKGRMADYMDDEETSIYENEDRTKIQRKEKVTQDFPDEIKIGENRLFKKDNIKGDILKGIVMKEILDKPRAIKPYKIPFKNN